MRQLLVIVTWALASSSTTAGAAELRRGENVGVGRDEVIDEDVYLAGSRVVVSGTVLGDVVAAGGDVLIDGNIEGSVIAAGGKVEVRGKVGRAVRAAGGEVRVDAEVGRDVVIAGGNLGTAGSALIGGDVLAAGSRLELGGRVARDLEAVGEDVTLAAQVSGAAEVTAESLTVTPSAAAELLSYGARREEIAAAAQLGEVRRRDLPAAPGFGSRLVTTLVALAMAVVTAVALLLLLPRAGRTAATHLATRPWESLALGALVAVLIVPVVLFLGFTVIGLPMGLLALGAFLMALYVAHLITGVTLGARLIGRRRSPGSIGALIGAAAAGLAVLYGLTLVPVLGMVVMLAATLLGVGALTGALARRRGRLAEVRGEEVGILPRPPPPIQPRA